MEYVSSDPVELMVALRGAPPRVVSFEAASKMRSQIVTSTLMWTTNSYHVNVERREFIINGGRVIHFPEWKDVEDVKALIVRRHRQEVSTTSEELGHSVSYLLGLEGREGGEKKEVMLHISPDGREWYWRNKR